MVQPDWAALPSADDLSAYYPKTANLLGLGGRASIVCRVDTSGVLQNCRVATEAPKGLGFGPAALRMAHLFRMRPMMVDGRPTAGGLVTVPIAMRLPPSAPAAARVTPGASAMQAARRLVAIVFSDKSWTAQALQEADALEFVVDDGTPPETRSAAAAAYRQAVAKRTPDVLEALAAATASTMSLAELNALTKTLSGPAGDEIRPNADLAAIGEMIRRDSIRVQRADAGEAFCAQRSCDLLSAFALTADKAQPSIPNPAWAQQPTAEQIASAEPIFAAALGVPAAAQLICKVDDQARPKACVVAGEAPAGIGVGAAALGLANDYRLNATAMAQGAVGETVAINQAFPPPEAGAPFTAPAPRSAQALASARRLIAVLATSDNGKAQWEAHWASIAAYAPAGSDPETRAAALGALRLGRVHAAILEAEQTAAAYAAIYSETQLAAAAAFATSPSGAAALRKLAQVNAAIPAFASPVMIAIAADARETFCRDHDCLDVGGKTAAAPSPQPIAASPSGPTATP